MKQYFGYIIALCVVVYIYLTLSDKINKNNNLIIERVQALIVQLDSSGVLGDLESFETRIAANTIAHGVNAAAHGANTAARGANETRIAANTAAHRGLTAARGYNEALIAANTQAHAANYDAHVANTAAHNLLVAGQRTGDIQIATT